MDNGVPPTSKRTSSRPAGSGGAKSRTAQPGDPRTEGANRNGNGGGGNGTRGRPGDNNGGANGRGNKQQQSKHQQRRDNATSTPSSSAAAASGAAAPSSTLAAPVQFDDVAAAVAVVTVDDAPETTTSVVPSVPLVPSNGSVAVALAEVLGETTLGGAARGAVLLPPIVPAEPSVLPDDDAPTEDAETAVVPELAPATVPEFTDTDGTDGLPSLSRPKKPPRALRAPVVVRQRRRPRVRRVTRVVRHVDTWSVFKVALVFNLFLYGVCLTAGVLLWQVAQNTGTVDNIERFFESFGWQRFQLKGGEIFHNSWIAGLFLVVGFTGLAVLMATLFNLITDLVGGIRVSVLEEEVVAREERGLGWRRARRAAAIAEPAAAVNAEPLEPI